VEELAIRIVESTPQTIRRLTETLTPEQYRARPWPREWSVIEIIGHLVDKTEVWGERFRKIAVENEPRLEAYDQDARVEERRYRDQELGAVLQRLAELTAALACDLRALPEEAWSRAGTHTERGRITLAEGVRLYAISLPEHVEQLIRTRDAALAGQQARG
jgi:uncharacterized damage-inducible protein DinB